MKAGYKTSEFWITLFTQIIGMLALFGVIEPSKSSELSVAVNTIVGGLFAILPAVVYVVNRTWLKSVHSQNNQL